MNRGVFRLLVVTWAVAHGAIMARAAPPDSAMAAAESVQESPADPVDESTGLPGSLTIRGRVTDSTGRAVAGARIFLEGARRESVAPDRNGRFMLAVQVGSHGSLIRSPLALWLNARRTGWRLGLASGAPRLRIELGAIDDSLGARHLLVRTNDAEATAALARAFNDGRIADTVDVAFVGAPGKEPEPRDVPLDAVADIVIVPGRLTSYDVPDSASLPRSTMSAPVVPGGSGRRTPEDRRKPQPKRGRNASPPPPITAATPGSQVTTPMAKDTCACRIEGTIEVQWNHPLPERVPVALWLEGAPTVRDSVELLLGSPRGFVLRAVGCGPHRVAYLPYSRLRFARLTPDPVIECTDQGQRQLRIVLEPVRPRLSR